MAHHQEDLSPTLYITMQEIQFVKQINMLQQKGFNLNHHSLNKQLQVSEDFPITTDVGLKQRLKQLTQVKN